MGSHSGSQSKVSENQDDFIHHSPAWEMQLGLPAMTALDELYV